MTNKKTNKIAQMTADHKQFAGNKETGKIEGMVHIEDWFDEFLETSTPYYKETYFKLLKYEDQFYYLKEFLVQIKLLAMPEIVKQIRQNTGAHKILELIPNLIPNSLSPFEELLTKWIISEYLFTYSHELKIKPDTFCNMVNVIVNRDIKDFGFSIELTDFMDGDDNYIHSWELIQNEQKIPSNLNPDKQVSKPIKSLKWQKNTVLLAYLLNELKTYGFIEDLNVWATSEQIFLDRHGKPIKAESFSSMVKNYEDNKTMDGSRGTPKNSKDIAVLIEVLKAISKELV